MRKLATLILALFAAGALAQGSFPGIEKLMTPEQYRAAGLDKLTEEERAALNLWLINYTAVDAPVIADTSEELPKADEEHELHTTIKPPFNGWSGETVFYLDNGQIWRQRLDGRMHYSGDDYRVVIKKNFFGYYKMTHIASGRSVGVSHVLQTQ